MTADLPTRKTDRGSTQAKTDRVSTIECPSAHQYLAFPGVRGKGIASRTLERPVT
jgi:hypothetical protein